RGRRDLGALGDLRPERSWRQRASTGTDREGSSVPRGVSLLGSADPPKDTYARGGAHIGAALQGQAWQEGSDSELIWSPTVVAAPDADRTSPKAVENVPR